MTGDGNLSISWEDREGKIIELEFFPDKIEYYIEIEEDEGVINDIVHKLRPSAVRKHRMF